LCIAATAFCFGVGCVGSLYYKPRIHKAQIARVQYKAQIAAAQAKLAEAQTKVVIQTKI